MCPASSCSSHSCSSPKQLQDGMLSGGLGGGHGLLSWSPPPALGSSKAAACAAGRDPEAPAHPRPINSPFGCPLVPGELVHLRLELLGPRRRLLVESLVSEPSPGQGGAWPPAARLQETGHEISEIAAL